VQASRRRFVLPAALAVLAISCGDDSTGPTPLPPATGSLRVTAATTGGGTDANGYTISLDGGASQRVTASGAVTIESLAAGGHVLSVGDVASGCVLDGPNPRGVNLAADAVTDVVVSVRCPAAASHPAGTVAAARTLSAAPAAVAVSRGVVYVALAGTTRLVRGDLASMMFGDTVGLGATPRRVAFGPSGTVAYVAFGDQASVGVVDVATNRLTRKLPLVTTQGEFAEGYVTDLAVAPDGRTVYVVASHGGLWALDAATLEFTIVPGVSNLTGALAFSPDGTTLYAAGVGAIRVVDVASNSLTRTVSIDQPFERMTVSPTSGMVYLLGATSGLTRFEPGTWQPNFHAGYDSPLGDVAVSPDGARIYLTDPAHHRLIVLDAAANQPQTAIGVDGTPRLVAFDPTGKTAVVTTDDGVVFVQ
jgi:DNA-binding beta-propeller fold protein YncE